MKNQERNWTSYRDNEGGTFGLRFKYTRKQWEEQAMEWKFGCGFDLEDISQLDEDEKEFFYSLQTMNDNELMTWISEYYNIEIIETTKLNVGEVCTYTSLTTCGLYKRVIIEEININQDNFLTGEETIKVRWFNKKKIVNIPIYVLYFDTSKICPHCGSRLVTSDIISYPYLCLDCDENFYEFEV